MLMPAIDIMLDDCPRLVEELEASIANGDIAAARRAAHTLECSMQMLGRRYGAMFARQMQRIVAPDSAEAAALCAKLRQETQDLEMDAERTLDPL